MFPDLDLGIHIVSIENLGDLRLTSRSRTAYLYNYIAFAAALQRT
jgi:hypothetical protein